MKLAVIAPCLYPSREHIHLLDESCTRQGISLEVHGVGEVFAGWRRMLLEHTIPHMIQLDNAGFSHVLYMDGIDSIAVAPIDEIVGKYGRYGSPKCLMSADLDIPTKNTGAFNGPTPWRYLNAGSYICEIPFIVGLMNRLAFVYEDEGDYQNWLISSYHSSQIMLDNDCQIFQAMTAHPSVFPVGKRLVNAATGSWPCILHFRGGYCDPVTGREERMRPILEELYG